MFLFSVYTGLAYVDVRDLTQHNIQYRADGMVWIVTARQKTNNPVNVMLLDTPLAIIEKYGGLDKKGRFLPIPWKDTLNVPVYKMECSQSAYLLTPKILQFLIPPNLQLANADRWFSSREYKHFQSK